MDTPSSTALLLMDFQNGIVAGFGDVVIDAAATALHGARSAGVNVLFGRVAFRSGYPEIPRRNQIFRPVRDFGDAMTETSPATRIIDRLTPRPDESVITKRRVSTFAGSDLDVLLRAADIRRIVVAGIVTSGVVLSTVRAASDLDLEITVLRDACADPDDEVNRVLLDKILPMQAEVITTSEWLRSLSSGNVE